MSAQDKDNLDPAEILLRDARCLIQRVERGEMDPEWAGEAKRWTDAVIDWTGTEEYGCPWHPPLATQG